MRKSRTFLAIAALILALAGGLAASDVSTLLAQQSANIDEPVWQSAETLARIGVSYNNPPGQQPEYDPAIIAAAQDATRSPAERMTASAALLRMGEPRVGTLGLEEVIMDASVPMGRRLEAAQILGKWGGEYATARLGILLDAPGVPERLRVELANSLWKLSSRPQAFEVLDEIRRHGQSPQARSEAILALAQTDHYNSLKDDVRALTEVPGSIGDRARNIMLLNARFEDQYRRNDFPVKVLNEVMDKIRDFYALDESDEEQVKRIQPKRLAETSAQALLYSLDQFNDYMNGEDYADFEAQLRANYGGIGAWVGMRDGRFTVLTPMYDKPAYRAGLKTMDVIDRIDDTDITNMKQPDIIKLLKGDPDTVVRVRVHRRSWSEPREIAITRKIIEIESVVAQVLPGDIGYIKINSFNEGDRYNKIKGTADRVKETLREFDKIGIKGVILDLSYNPGGVMQSGVDVAKLFIGNRKVIVSSRGKKNRGSVQVYNANRGNPIYTKPVVVVVNPASASAAEILAGAMRDHSRAPLVGRKTFGKGSVQSLMPVSVDDKARIKLTIAKYYLPNGDCIHEKGIEPDHKVPESDMSMAEAEAKYKIRDQHDVTFWLEENDRFNRYESVFRQLLEFDNLDPYAYPEMETLITYLQGKHPKVKVDPELVRQELRYGLATYLKDIKGEKRYVDLEENAYLQEAVVVLGDMIGGLPQTPLYTTVRELAEKNRRKVLEEEGDLAEGKKP